MDRTSGTGHPIVKVDPSRTGVVDYFEQLSNDLEGSDALEICRWSVDRFGDDLVVASSFQDAVLIDLMVRANPRAEIVFIDTGFHFPETIEYLHDIDARYGLNLTILEPGIPLDVDPCGSPACCTARKVEPLNRHLTGKAAWVTGLKRVDTPERAHAPVISFDESHSIVKINPMATWTDHDVDRYVDAHDLPRHPLNAKGYVSIGCAPMTRPIAAGRGSPCRTLARQRQDRVWPSPRGPLTSSSTG